MKQKTGDKQTAIKRATIAEVVATGSSAASVNMIAKRAGIAVGTIYRYYESKDHLLRATYLTVKADVHAAIVSSLSSQVGSRANIRSMWFAILDFAQTHPKAFLFAEVVLNDLILTDEERKQIDGMAQEIRAVIERAIEEKVVRDLNINAVVTLLSAPVLRLGRAAAMSGTAPEPSYAEDVFKLCWHAIEL